MNPLGAQEAAIFKPKFLTWIMPVSRKSVHPHPSKDLADRGLVCAEASSVIFLLVATLFFQVSITKLLPGLRKRRLPHLEPSEALIDSNQGHARLFALSSHGNRIHPVLQGKGVVGVC